MWLWATVSTSALAELNVNIQQVLLNLHDAEKFVQKQEDLNSQMKASLRDSNGEMKAMTLEEMGIRKEEDGLRKELEKERNKYGQLQNASLKLASEYKTLLNNRNELQKENGKLRTEKTLVMSAFNKIKAEMNPFVAVTPISPSNLGRGAQNTKDSSAFELKKKPGGVMNDKKKEGEDKNRRNGTAMMGRGKKKGKKQEESSEKATSSIIDAVESAPVMFPLTDETLDASISGNDDELNALTVESPEMWSLDDGGDDQLISMVQEAGFMKAF